MRVTRTLSAVLGSAALVAGVFTYAETTHADQAAAKTIVLIGGTNTPTPGEHDHEVGTRVLKTIVDSSPQIQALKVRVEAYPDGWPADESVLEQASTVVWYFGGDGNHPLLDAGRRARFQQLIDRGVGVVALHQSSTLPADDTATPLPEWLGGARYSQFDRSTETVSFQPVNHPTTRGVGPFLLREEFYPTIRFPDEQRIVPILPGTFHVEIERGKPIPMRVERRPAAWAFERQNGGRAFTFTGLHYLLSFDHGQVRRLLLNAIAWTAGIDIPPTGIGFGAPGAAAQALAARQ